MALFRATEEDLIYFRPLSVAPPPGASIYDFHTEGGGKKSQI